MKIIAIIKCDSCCTLKEIELKEGENVVHGCGCPYPYGEDGGKVTIETKHSR